VLSGLGAKVTSVDFSEQQLNVARRRATELGLNLTLVRADVVDLSALRDETSMWFTPDAHASGA
jgi:ubiquinone/menaquinone biosynthesis C-methylase UbiE